jgi:hypothetical protein
VGIVGPRLKKLRFYDWEKRFNQSQINSNIPFSQKTLLSPTSENLETRNLQQMSKNQNILTETQSEIPLS